MKFNEITENASSGSTGAGSIASVSSPMSTQSRNPSIYNGKKAGNLLTGKKSKGKYANSVQARKQMKINEAEQRADIVRYFRDFDDKLRSKYIHDWAVENNIDGNDAMEMAGYVKGAHSGGRHGSYMWYYQPDHSLNAIPDPKESVQEAEVLEQEVLVIPGTKRKDRKKGFVKHGESRVDHEVKMAKADLFATAKNAREIMECLKDRSEEEGIKGWMQSYITLANDYLNSVNESLQYEMQMHEDQVAAYGNGADDRINTRNKLDKEPYGGPSSSYPGGQLQSTSGVG